MQNCKWLKVSEIFDDIQMVTEGIDKKFMMAQSSKAVERLLPADTHELKLKIINVTNYEAELPADFKQMCEVMYNKSEDYSCSDKQVYGYVKEVLGTDCKITCGLCDKGNIGHNGKCQTCLDLTPGSQDLRYNPEWYYKKVKWKSAFYDSNSCNQKTPSCKYELLKPASSVWHLEEVACKNLMIDCEDTYRVENCKCKVTTSFQEGKLIIAYMAACCDSTGEPLIPNDSVVIDAIVIWVNYKWAFKMYNKSMKSTEDFRMWKDAYLTYRAQAHEMTARVREKYSIPTPAEMTRFIDTVWRQRGI